MYPQYTARIHSHCTHSTQLEYIVTVPTVHCEKTYSLYIQCTARIHSYYANNTQLEYIVTVHTVHSYST